MQPSPPAPPAPLPSLVPQTAGFQQLAQQFIGPAASPPAPPSPGMTQPSTGGVLDQAQSALDRVGQQLTSGAASQLDQIEEAVKRALGGLGVQGAQLLAHVDDALDNARLQLAGEAAHWLGEAQDALDRAHAQLTSEANAVLDVAKEKAATALSAVDVAKSLASSFAISLAELPADWLNVLSDRFGVPDAAFRRLKRATS